MSKKGLAAWLVVEGLFLAWWASTGRLLEYVALTIILTMVCFVAYWKINKISPKNKYGGPINKKRERTYEQATPLTLALPVICQTKTYTDSGGRKRRTKIRRYRDILPDFRVNVGLVEIPAAGWHLRVPDSQASDLAHKMLERLIAEASRAGRIPDGAKDGIQTSGIRIPMEAWDKYANMIGICQDRA